MAKVILNTLADEGLQLYPSATEYDATYLKLNTSNSPLTGGLTIQPATNTLTALVVNNNASGNVLTVDTINNRVGMTQNPTIGGYTLTVPETGTAALLGTANVFTVIQKMSGGLKSPYTRTVIVDYGGKGDFTTVKDACDYVATQSPGATAPWLITVNPSNNVYVESPFTIPSYTTVRGNMLFSHNDVDYIAKIQINLTSGNGIVMGVLSKIFGLYITQTGTPTGNCNLIYSNSPSTAISNCVIYAVGTASTYTIRALCYSGTSTIYISNSAFQHYGSSGTYSVVVENTNTGTLAINYSIFVEQISTGIGIRNSGGGKIMIAHCKLSDNSGVGFGTYDLDNTSGIINVNNTPYVKYNGTIVHYDVLFNSYSGAHIASSPTEIPSVIRGAVSQTASLVEFQNSSATVLAKVSGTGVITSPNFVSTIATGTAPIAVTSTTVNTNLNADLLDGNHAAAFQVAAIKGGGTLTAGTTTTVTIAGATASSVILIQSTSAAITTLGVYVSAKNSGSFVLTHAIALGTETFDYAIIN